MSLSHRHGWPTAEAAERSKVYLANPGAVIVADCRFCDKVHVDVPKAPEARLPRPRSQTGFPAAVKLATRKRAGLGDARCACCECCGHWLGLSGGEIQHRIARGMGGCRDVVINGAVNAALLCGNRYEGCHSKAEDRDPEMRRRGFWLNSWENPATEPVMMFNPNGLLTVWLTADGTYSLVQPEVAAA